MVVGYDPKAEKHLSEFWQGVSGTLSGALTRLICQPLDVIKIRFQLQIEPIRRHKKHYYWNLVHAISKIEKEETIKALWKGHMCAQLLSCVYGLVQFSCYGFLTKQAFIRTQPKEHNNSGVTKFICGSVSGAAATVASYPFDTLRTRFVGQGEPKIYKNTVDALSKMIRAEGYLSLYKGLWPTLVLIIPQSGFLFLSYDHFVRLYLKTMSKDTSLKLNVIESVICGGAAGVVAKTLVYPLDLIKKRYQVQGFEHARRKFGKTTKYTALYGTLKKIFAEEGAIGFYKGLWPSILKSMATTALSFTFYEQISSIMK